MNQNHEWLAGLKAGDEVAIFAAGYGRTHELAKVDRVTATQVVIGIGRYRRSDGRKIGTSGRWTSAWLRELTPQIRAECYERKIRADIARIQWDKVPLANLLDVLRQIP